jgi:hypothetical protein
LDRIRCRGRALLPVDRCVSRFSTRLAHGSARDHACRRPADPPRRQRRSAGGPAHPRAAEVSADDFAVIAATLYLIAFFLLPDRGRRDR